MVKNMIFDVGNVLVDYDPERFLKTFIPGGAVRRAVREALFEAPEWKLADAGGITEEGQLAAAVRRCPQHEAEIRRAFATWHTDLPPVAGMPSLLRQLKAGGYPLYLLTNFSGRFHALEEGAVCAELMDGILVSSDCKLAKPQREIYLLLLERFGLAAGECLFIDDLAANVGGARDAGLQAHLFLGADELRAFLNGEGIL